jgi:hypothetical protein
MNSRKNFLFAAPLVLALLMTLAGCPNPSGGGSSGSGKAETPEVSFVSTDVSTYVDENVTLQANAAAADNGILSYQWYRNTGDEAAVDDDHKIAGATSSGYNPPVTTAGVTYYYVVVTNIGDGSKDPVSVTSVLVKVTVAEGDNRAAKPEITADLTGQIYYKDTGTGAVDTPNELKVTVTPIEGVTFQYQWYKNTANEAVVDDDHRIAGADTAAYTPVLENPGVTYYYVVVTNPGDGDEDPNSVTSEVAAIELKEANISGWITFDPDASLAGRTYTKGVTADEIEVKAGVAAGVLSYQWYKNTANEAVFDDGHKIADAATAKYRPSTADDGTLYYYCMVTNTETGKDPRQAYTGIAAITVTAVERPVITAQPQGASYTAGAAALALSVTVTALTDGGTLSYQWYSNAGSDTSAGTVISGAAAASYTPPVADVGITHYYVKVTNTKDGQTETVTSTAAKIEVAAPGAPAAPAITAQPQGASYTAGTAASALSVTVTPLAAGAGTLSYQWYSNAANSTSGGTAISGATAASYTPPATSAGITYYYVIVTNTKDGQTKTVTSSAAKIEINSSGTPTYNITVTSPANGSFTVKAGNDAVTKAAAGTTITLTASPASGYQFKQWTVTGATVSSTVASPATFTMPAGAVTVAAEFEATGGTPPATTYTITVTPPSNGSFTVKAGGTDVTEAAAGTTITLTASPASSYQFKQWTVTGATVSSTTASPATFTMPAGAVTVAAEFEATGGTPPPTTYNITVTSPANGSFTVKAGSTDVTEATAGTTITLTASPASSYQFKQWNVTGATVSSTTASPATFTMPAGAVTVAAEFEVIPPAKYAITAQTATGGTFTVKAGDADVTEAAAGTTITLAASPASSYQFKQWNVTGATVSSATANPATFTMPSTTVTVTAEFEQVSTVTFNAMGGTGGPNPVTVAVGGSVSEPDVTGMTKGADTFDGWFTDTTLRTAVDFSAAVTADKTVYAKWDNEYFLVVNKNADWQVVGQVVWLAPGTYKLGVEYKLGRIASNNTYGKLTVSVQWVSGGATQNPAFNQTFTNGNHQEWTRSEIEFTASLNTNGGDKGYGGWYRIGIEDAARSSSARNVYVNRVWIYPENATSATENKLVDADFANHYLPLAADRTGDRFLDVSSAGPHYTNANIPNWVEGTWVEQCFKWWGATGANFWLYSDPSSIENY